MKTQPQPPERRKLHRSDDPSSVLRDAEIPYGYGPVSKVAEEPTPYRGTRKP